MDSSARYLSKSFEREISPTFGVIVLFSTFALVLYYTGTLYLGPVTDRAQALTLVGFLPEDVLHSDIIFRSLKGIVFLGVLLWAFHIALPLSPWITLLAFTFIICQSIESKYYTYHMYHIVNVTLFVSTLWYTFDCQTLKSKRNAAALLRGVRVPYFVFFVPIFYLAVSYTFSGLTKLYHSGLGWANGTSLQIWLLFYQDKSTWLGDLIISNKLLAKFLLSSTLFFESTAILAMLFTRLRPLYGLGLVGFHVGVEICLGFAFYGNIVCDLLFFVIYPPFFKDREKPGNISLR